MKKLLAMFAALVILGGSISYFIRGDQSLKQEMKTTSVVNTVKPQDKVDSQKVSLSVNLNPTFN